MPSWRPSWRAPRPSGPSSAARRRPAWRHARPPHGSAWRRCPALPGSARRPGPNTSRRDRRPLRGRAGCAAARGRPRHARRACCRRSARPPRRSRRTCAARRTVQPLAQVAELGRQLFLQLGHAGAGLPDACLGVGAGIAGTLTQGRDDLVDPLEGQISGADRGKQRGLQVVSGRLVLLRSSWPWCISFPETSVDVDEFLASGRSALVSRRLLIACGLRCFVLLAKRRVDVEQHLLLPLGDRAVGDDRVADFAGLAGFQDPGPM